MSESKCRSANVLAQMSGHKCQGANVGAQMSELKCQGANVRTQIQGAYLGERMSFAANICSEVSANVVSANVVSTKSIRK